MKPQIVNIINFIRGVEPRQPDLDLMEPVVEQIRLLKKYKLPGTFLIQYDALIQNKYVETLKTESDDSIETGVWFEIVKPLVEKAGLKWRGRKGFDWDWHSNVGFSVGYEPEEREVLIDVLMEGFRKAFGDYPKSVGSWLIDAHSLEYMSKKYKIVASCNCKDQWGTDGYTLWGGYFNQAYYPSRKNVFTPAQNVEMQIPVPIFRMLGSDPIYQYDAGMDSENNPSEIQPVITLEPVYDKGGGSPLWVQWFFRENFNGICLSFGYTQVGQENSFGWNTMSKGLENQIALIAEKAKKGELRIETLCDSARWFKSKYNVTPAAAVAALSDWKNEGRKSMWYSSRFYRVNFYVENENFKIRDIHLFSENYPERYLNSPCKLKDMVYDNLPVMDGNRWSSDKIRAGIRFVKIDEDGSIEDLKIENIIVSESSDNELNLILSAGQRVEIIIRCNDSEISVNFLNEQSDSRFGLYFQWSDKVASAVCHVGEKAVKYMFNGYEYFLYPKQARNMEWRSKNSFVICPCNKEVTLCFSNIKEAQI